MKTRQYTLTIILVLFATFSGFKIVEEPQFLYRLKNSLLSYNASYPEEKIYAQFDKPFYKPGEDIWFNAFVVNNNTHQPASTSDILYVELIDPKGNVFKLLSLPIKEGTANGDFAIDASAPGGLYRVRAYTKWMKNFGEDRFFQKHIQIQRISTPRLLFDFDFEKESYGPGDDVAASLKITNLKNETVKGASVRYITMIAGKKIREGQLNSDAQGKVSISFSLPDTLNTTDGLLQVVILAAGVEESISRSIPIVLDRITLQFFPEGGHWIEGVPSVIAFKAMNEFGKGADVAGVIVDDQGKVVTDFKSFHMGMGSFQITPRPGRKYHARINTPAGNEQAMQLPSPVESGFSLQLKQTNSEYVEWMVHTSLQAKAYLVGQAHGNILYSSPLDLEQGENIVRVSIDRFPAGIAVFTLFDFQGVEQCERLTFVNTGDLLNISISTDKAEYLPQEKVNLKVNTTDRHGKPVKAKVSIAVVDDQLISFADDKQDNILSSLLLSSELRGEIQEPSFYFDPEEPKARQALDYLMMTHGWRRFTWKQVASKDIKILHSPEKVTDLSGQIVRDGKGIKTDVTLVEMGNKKRIHRLETTLTGHFTFRNIDPTVRILLLARKPDEISISKVEAFSVVLDDANRIELPLGDFENEKSSLEEEIFAEVVVQKEPLVQEQSASDFSLTLENDVTSLSEVIVTGYGVEDKRSLAGSVTVIGNNALDNGLPSATLEGLLNGRVAGIIIHQQSGNPAANASIKIRGSSSFLSKGEPLYVVDGVPLESSLNQNFSNAAIIGPEDVNTIEVIPSPEASALFGSAAANGAILITTKSQSFPNYFRSRKKAPKYNSFVFVPRSFSATREFYVAPKESNQRNDFRTTVYWNHTVVTDERGEAKLTFRNNDAVSSFRITAEGISGNGLVGRKEQVYITQIPLSLDVKLPEFIGFEDTLRLPVHVKNESPKTQSGKISITLPYELSVTERTTQEIEVAPGMTNTLIFTVTSNGVAGGFPIKISFNSHGHQDKVEHVVQVRPVGYPTKVSYSSRELDNTIKFFINQPERGTLKAEFVAFPSVINDLFTGAESILREPHGCFEQVSSSTFPNILVLQFLKQSEQISPDIERKAMGYLRDGYKKLAAYEIADGGFEWFGRPPAHEGLTAYGLVEFHEMQKVFNGVDQKMVERTRDFLLSRRDEKGGFRVQNSQHGFNDVDAITNAYITYALSETGTKQLDKEYKHAFDEAFESKDMYRLALVANTAHNLGMIDNYRLLVNIFKEKVNSSGFSSLKAQRSIVWSDGVSLQTETLALWTIALMKSSKIDQELVDKCIKQILTFRTFGQFGSTQGTTLALKALTEYAKLLVATKSDGEIQLIVNNHLAENFRYTRDAKDKIILNAFDTKLQHNSEQSLRVAFHKTDFPLPYSLNLEWYSKIPQTSANCKVNLATQLAEPYVRKNETVRMTVTLKNKTQETLPMITSVIGIPAGLTVQPWQLKELMEKNAIAFYEITNGKLILYHRQMSPGVVQNINLDLKAEFPGTFTGAASCAYLYYTNEYKSWSKGNSIIVY